MDKKTIWIRAAMLLMVIMLSLTACGGGDGKQQPPEETPTQTPSEEPTLPTQVPVTFSAPYTGLPHEVEPVNRPIAVMVNNFSAARPQSGLTNADVVWEVLAEGGITRLIAIFQSTNALTDTIGPIRSNRPYLIDVADSYKAVMSHAGASPEGYGILQKQKKPYLDEISNAGPYYWRSKDRKAPHNLYSNLEKLREGAAKRGYDNDKPQIAYTFTEAGSVASDPLAKTAEQLSFIFTLKNYKVGYQYDASTSVYKRTINGEPHIDKNNDQQLSATNLIIFETAHKTLDNEGRLSVDLTKGGKALLFQKGKVMEAEWVRASDGMLRWVKDGKELELIPGKTFIHIVPSKASLLDHITIEQSSEQTS